MLLLLGLGLGPRAQAQLQPLLDQHQFNRLAINPAYAGSEDALNMELYARSQWVGFDGAPKTYTFSLHAPLRNKKVNLGLIVLNDRLGNKRETGLLLNYAYRMELGRGKWSLGLGAGLSHLSSDLNSVIYTDLDDRLLLDLPKSTILPEFSIGSYYFTDRLFVGVSMPLLLSHYTNEDNAHYKLSFQLAAANYLLTAGYLFTLTDDFGLQPSLLIKTNPKNNSQMDLHCTLILRDKIWLGAGVRTNGSLSTLLRLQVNPQLKIAYSYAYELTELSSYQHGSHEVVLQYTFKYILDVIGPRSF